MSDKKSEEMIGKLGKVADSLETASTQLSNVVTQQQIDVVRERLSKCEADNQATKAQITAELDSKNAKIEVVLSKLKKIQEAALDVEKDVSGLRALTLSSFVVSLICLVGMILCLVRL